jgi:hypothetical protein
MNTFEIKTSQTVGTNSKEMQNKIYAVFDSGRKQISKLAWLFKHTPGYGERLLLDEYLGPEIRRMKW